MKVEPFIRVLTVFMACVCLQDALKDGHSGSTSGGGGGGGGCSSSSSESFKRLPKKRKFDLSDFETQSEPNVLPVTTASPISTASVVTYSSSSSSLVPSSNVPSSVVVSNSSVVNTSSVIEERELVPQNAAILPSSMPSSVNCQSAIVANRHVNTIHSTVYVTQQQHQQQSVVVRDGGGGELRSPENIHHLKPASAIVLNSSQNNSVPPRVITSISQPVIVTSSPGLNSHPSHHIVSNNSSIISDSYSIQQQAPKVNNMLSNHPYERQQPSAISTAHHVIKSPTSYSASPHSHQPQGLSLSVRDQTSQESSIYSSSYGPNQNRAVVTQQPGSMYKVGCTTTPSAALSPPNSVLAMARQQQDNSPHVVHSQQSDQQPMDLGCRSGNSRVGVHHGRSLSPPPQHIQSQQQSHYGAITQSQQQSVVNYQNRSPSPSAYRVQHIHTVHTENIPSSRQMRLSPPPQTNANQQGQYGTSAFRHHLSPKVIKLVY